MRYKKILSIVVIVALLVPAISFLIPVKASGLTYGSVHKGREFTNESTWEQDIALYNIPVGTQRTNLNGLPLNLTLWVERNLIVYGNYKDVNLASITSDKNRFKDVVTGYYKKGTSQGEYEYHGFTLDGLLYTNVDFPNDADSGRSPEDNKYVFLPWDDPVTKAKGEIQSVWNDKSKNYTIIETWINEGLDLNIINSTTTNDSLKKPVYHLNILQAPSARFPGEGKMWNVGNNGKYYYANYSVDPVAYKEHPNLDGQFNVLNDELILQGDEDTFNLELDLIGTLKDETFYQDPLLSSVYYTREDIVSWEFKANNEDAISGNHSNITWTKGNQAKGYFNINIPRVVLEANSTIDLTGYVQVNFYNGDSIKYSVEDSVTIAVMSGLTSYFSVYKNVQITDVDGLDLSDINYTDGSYGDITQYDLSIQELAGSNSSSQLYNAPISNSSVNQFLYDFISPKVSGLAIGESKQFKVTQIVYEGTGSDTYSVTITVEKVEIELPIMVNPNANIPNIAFDVIPFSASDSTNSSDYASRTVYVNGKQVDDNLFFSGNYVFGIGNHGIKKISIKYISVDGIESEQIKWVKVYDTKPRVQFDVDGSHKQNRKMTITNTSANANDPYVLSNYPINNYSWTFTTVEGALENFKLNDISDMYKEFLSKEPGTYHVKLVGTNTLGRNSDPYDLDVHIFEDYKPAIEANIWNNVLARGETLNMEISTSSTDGDNIASSILEIYYDSDNDGTTETLLDTFNTDEFTDYTVNELGNYKVVVTAVEEFGEETLNEYVTEDDRKSNIVERVFFVDNYRPVTDLYIDIPIDMPEVDVYIMNDKDLDRTKNDTILSNRMNMANDLLLENIIPGVNIWDMNTYVYSQSASRTKRTGTSYPPSSVSYLSGGYSGTLSRYKVVDNGEWVDKGSWKTKTDSKPYSTTRSNTRTYYYAENGTLTKTTFSWGNSNNHPSISVNVGGYTGTLSKSSGWSGSESYTYYTSGAKKTAKRTYYARYSGTISKQITYWDEKLVWVKDYKGYYSGTIYKNVRQSFSDPFNATSFKYVFYVSDDDINELDDLNMVLDKADTKLILIGDNTITSQVASYDLFIQNNGEPIEDLVNQAINFIKTENVIDTAKITTLVGEGFNISYGNLDLDGDSIVEEQFQIVHNPDYYDNPLGQGVNTTDTYSDSSNWITTAPGSFTKPGEYTVYRRIKDDPSTDPNFADFAMYSGSRALKVYVHRKPIAQATLDWDFDTIKGVYLTTWVDNSYDPDHEFSDPNKGIVESNIKYQRNGGAWYYKIPDELTPGTYNVEYTVKDKEGVWASAWTMGFTLDNQPPVQFVGKAKTELVTFNMNSVPASENLIAYDLWTRYPYTLHLEYAIYQGATRKTSVQTVTFSEGVTGSKTGNDIAWNDLNINIPSNLSDGNYTLEISAIDTFSVTNKTDLNFDFIVNAPINLTANVTTISAGQDYTIEAETTKYASNVQVIMFKGTAYQTILTLTDILNGDLKDWSKVYNGSTTIPEGSYNAEFVATTSSGKTERVTVSYDYVHNTPPEINSLYVTPAFIYEGDTVTVNILPNDIDLKDLILDLELYKDGALHWTGSYIVSPNGASYDEQHIEILNSASLGAYDFDVKLTDSYGEEATQRVSFAVNQLTVSGNVQHTTLWNEHRIDYNQAKSGTDDNPRSYDTFWTGEKLILNATTTQIDPQSTVIPLHVQVQIINEAYSTLLNINLDGYTWNSELWDNSMMNKWGRNAIEPLSLRFTATYSNGTIKTFDVTINMDSRESYWVLHRKW